MQRLNSINVCHHKSHGQISIQGPIAWVSSNENTVPASKGRVVSWNKSALQCTSANNLSLVFTGVMIEENNNPILKNVCIEV